LNIITTKLKAAPRATSGTDRVFTTVRTRFPAVTHTGTMAAPSVAQVAGLR